MTVAVILMLPVLVSLGFWQLHRAAEKRGYETRYLEHLGMPAQPPPASWQNAGFLRVRLQGHYQTGHYYLVDNRIRDGRVGYWVVSRFQADDGRVYLVNRGWIAAPASRDQLPAAPAPDGHVRLVGVAWPYMGLAPLLAPDPWPDGWPIRVERLDVARMAAGDASVVPVEIRLEAGQPGVLAAAPVDVDFNPERHQGYAVQWFAMAVTLAILYVVFGFKQSGGET